MGSDERLEAMRAYEAILWPAIEHAERHYRRTDLLACLAFIGGLMMLTAGTSLLRNGPFQGFAIGLTTTIAFAAGIAYKGILVRRSHYQALRTLHEQAELTLLYHHGDDDEP